MKARNLILMAMMFWSLIGTAIAAQPQEQEYSVITTEGLKSASSAESVVKSG